MIGREEQVAADGGSGRRKASLVWRLGCVIVRGSEGDWEIGRLLCVERGEWGEWGEWVEVVEVC